MTRGPCPWCGALYITRRWFSSDGEELREILDHECSAYAPVEPLPAGWTDTTFIKEAQNGPDGLIRYRRSLPK